MYARGMSQRDISATIEDIYGFEISHDTISQITDCVLDELLFVTEPLSPVQALIAITKHSAVNIPTAFFINSFPFCCYI